MTSRIQTFARSLLLGAAAIALMSGTVEPTAGGSSLIDSVEQVSVAITGTDTSNTATITSVDTARTTIFYQGFTSAFNAATAMDETGAYGTLTSSTVVTFTRNTGTSGSDCVHRAIVVQWASGVLDGVEYGTVTITDTNSSNTATISSVTTTDSAITYIGNSSDTNGTAYSRVFGSCAITSATQVTGYKGNTANAITIGFCVTEFAASVLDQSTEQFNINVTVLTNTATISTSTEGQTLCFYGGFQCTSANANWQKWGYIQQTSDTVFTATRSDSTNDFTIYGTAVKFKSADVASRNEGVATIAINQTVQDTTITSVDTSKTITVFLGANVGTTNTILRETASTVYQTSSTNIRVERDTADVADTAGAGWQAMELT